jgi:radical SAM protein with 4Fe4S-binding SPASM domain
MKYYLNNSYKQMHASISSVTNHICPEKLYLDITENCNLFCQMCRDQLCASGKTMDIALYKRIVDETAPYVKSYSLFNWGEPLLVKDFKERVEYLNKRKLKEATIDISTNGMLLSSEMIDFLYSNKVIATVSFDGADKATFEHIRRGANFERICINIKKLTEVYEGLSIDLSPGIYTSIQKDNSTQLKEIAELAYSLGIRRMGYGLVSAPEKYAPVLNDSLRHEIEQTSKFLDSHKMLNDLYPTRVGDYLWSGEEYVSVDKFILNKNCNAPMISASITYNGDVFLCCNVGEYVDNINNKSFLDVWQGKRYDELRCAVNSCYNMPERCKKCTWVNR